MVRSQTPTIERHAQREQIKPCEEIEILQKKLKISRKRNQKDILNTGRDLQANDNRVQGNDWGYVSSNMVNTVTYKQAKSSSPLLRGHLEEGDEQTELAAWSASKKHIVRLLGNGAHFDRHTDATTRSGSRSRCKARKSAQASLRVICIEYGRKILAP